MIYWSAWCLLAPRLTAWLAGGGWSAWSGLLLTALIMVGGKVLLMLPFDYYSEFSIEHRFDLSTQTPRGWAVFQLKNWLVGGIIGLILLSGLYASLWYGGGVWFVWVWLGVMTLSIVLAKVFPLIILPLFYTARPLERPSLTDRLTTLAEQARLTLSGVYDLALSSETRKANAMLAGLGSSRRVYLSDTLLQAFDDDQICVVFAHELGHHIRGHIWKGIGIAALASSIVVATIAWRLNPLAGDPARWPEAAARLAQVMLLLAVVPLAIAPITNAISRRFERQCDADALRMTGNPAAYRTAFENLSRLNLADPDPPRWEVILFEDHPPLRERIAMADNPVPTG